MLARTLPCWRASRRWWSVTISPAHSRGANCTPITPFRAVTSTRARCRRRRGSRLDGGALPSRHRRCGERSGPLLVIAVSFLPVLTLEAQEGRLFKPLAYTKNFAMVVAAFLAITLDPALRLFIFRKDNFRIPGFIGKAINAILVGKIHSEEKHPISRVLMRLYEPVVAWSLRWKWADLCPRTRGRNARLRYLPRTLRKSE